MPDLETKALLERWFELDADERGEFIASLDDEQVEKLMQAVAAETGIRFWPAGSNREGD